MIIRPFRLRPRRLLPPALVASLCGSTASVVLYKALAPPNKLLIRSCSLGFDGCWTCGLPGRRPPHEVKVDDDDDENAWLRPLARLLCSEEERDASPQSAEIEWGSFN